MAIFSGLLTFLLSFIAWRHLQPGGILFYQGIACSFFGAAVSLTQGYRERNRGGAVPFKDALLVLFMTYAFMFTIPTTVERSYTVKMLEKLSDEGSMSEPQLLSWIENHWRTPSGLAKRLGEQRASGSIDQNESEIRLTTKGKMLVRSFRFSALVFNTGSTE